MRLADQTDTASNAGGDLGRFMASRRRQNRLSMPRDPEDAPRALTEQLGSRWAAIAWLLAALEAAEGEPRHWRDHHRNRVAR